MLIKIVALLVVVCFSTTFGSVPGDVPAPAVQEIAPGGVPLPRRAGGIQGGTQRQIPGGIGACELDITPLHSQVASLAIAQMGPGYSLRRILGVRTQVVAGTMYYFELHVTNNDVSKGKCETCDVKAWHRLPNGGGVREVVLQNYTCRPVCCHL